ncbi:MAG: GAF domain-containing protein [Anaerolineales bacterium]|nr:GAF domain-containing protein [Anaerolineales bacterium]
MTEKNSILKAAKFSYDPSQPSRAMEDLMICTRDTLDVDRVALYEFDEKAVAYLPRFASGISVSKLGHLSSRSDHPFLKKVLNSQTATTTNGHTTAIGVPLAPGSIACAPCLTNSHPIGFLFAAAERDRTFTAEDLVALEILALRAADILSGARHLASQGYLSNKLALVYQATEAITEPHKKQESIKQTAAFLLRATSADACDITLFDHGESTTSRFRLSIGKSGKQKITTLPLESMPPYPIHDEVVQKRKPAKLGLIPPTGSTKDLAFLEQEGIAAAAIFPLAPHSDVLGIARLIYEQAGRQILEQDFELAQAIINIGSIGLEDAVHLAKAEQHANQLQVLEEIGKEMTSTLDLETALENAMHYTQNVLQAEACVLFLLDENGEELILKATGGRQLRLRDVAIRLEEGIAGWVARNGKPLIVNDVRTNPLYQSAIDGQTGLLTASVLCVPLGTRGECLGVIQAINHPRGAFTAEDQQVLSSVASWAAIAIDNANLFERVAEERRRLEATLVETADAVVITDKAGMIILVNKTAAQLFRINAGMASNRHASEIFIEHPLGDLLSNPTVKLPVSTEITTPSERVLFTTISEITGVGRVAVMQDITALKQIDHMRSQLLGTAAHDLKNPLNAIRLGADLLSDAPLSPQQFKALSMMQRATDSMTNLISGLLETIRLESESNPTVETCLLDNLIRKAIEDLSPLAEDKKHTIEYTPPGEQLEIVGNPGRLTSVITNLLSNAIKFTDPGGLIQIKLSWDEDYVQVDVIDNGPGIVEDEIPRVFDHLFRGRNAIRDPNNPIEGTGLGLALAKTVIEQHGGRIWLTSCVDEGTSFHFTLPWEPIPKTGSLRHHSTD